MSHENYVSIISGFSKSCDIIKIMFRNFLFATTIQMGVFKAHFWNAVPNLILDGFDKNQEISSTKHILDLARLDFWKFLKVVWKNLLPLAESESKAWLQFKI